jgi:hypothetical protein
MRIFERWYFGLCNCNLRLVITHGYATPVTPNVLFDCHNPIFFQNNTCGSHPKAFISPQIKTILWLNAMVLTDVVRVSEPTECTLRLSVRVFNPLPDGGEKTQNPGSNILNLGSRKFWKNFENMFLYIIAVLSVKLPILWHLWEK